MSEGLQMEAVRRCFAVEGEVELLKREVRAS
jgi:hypothetical protein